jgi:hypothetical protein
VRKALIGRAVCEKYARHLGLPPYLVLGKSVRVQSEGKASSNMVGAGRQEGGCTRGWLCALQLRPRQRSLAACAAAPATRLAACVRHGAAERCQPMSQAGISCRVGRLRPLASAPHPVARTPMMTN